MNIQALNADIYQYKVVADRLPALIEFWADWCVYCLLLKPKIERLAELFGDHIFVGRLDIDQHTDLMHCMKISRVPAVTFILDGRPVKRWYGDHHINEFIKAINKCVLAERTP